MTKINQVLRHDKFLLSNLTVRQFTELVRVGDLSEVL